MDSLFRKTSAWLPLAMSAAGIALVLVYISVVGIAEPQAATDEGAAARLFQLLIIGQVPIIAYFALRWMAKVPRQGLTVLALQCAAILAALGLIFFLEL